MDVSESMMFLEVEIADKETSTELIETTNQSAVTNKTLSKKEHPKHKFKNQLSDNSTSTNSMMIDVPSIFNEAIDALVNMKILPINMSTQLNYEKIKKGINLSGCHIDTQITKLVACKNQHINIKRYLIT